LAKQPEGRRIYRDVFQPLKYERKISTDFWGHRLRRNCRRRPPVAQEKRMRFASVIAASLLWFALLVGPSQAADIKILSTRAVMTILEKIGPEFERDTGHRLDVSSDIALNNVRRVMAGEPFDLLIASPAQMDDLIKSGKIRGETRTNLVRSGIGVEVRTGAPKPAIGTLEAFKAALLSAKSVGYLKEGQSGVYLHSLFQRMGIAEALGPKTVRPDTDIVSELVAKGEIELGLVVITQILTTPGVELVGPIPQEIQSYITFVAGIGASASAPDAARALLDFLKSPAALPVIKAQGMEPG
jgi:molybdate transport system substrate-binding protein